MMLRRNIALSMLLVTSFAAWPAEAGEGEEATQASQMGMDQVTLKDGSMVRGTVIEEVPGDRVVIAIFGQAEPRTLSWNEIADVERGKYAPSKPASGSTAPPGYAEVAEPELELEKSGVVKLHIESEEPVTLYRVLGTSVGHVGGYGVVSTTFEAECVSPCDQVVDGGRGEEFFVTGDDVPNPGAFTLTGWSGDTTLAVDAGNSGLRIGGAVLNTLGVLGVIAGGSLLITGALVDSDTLMPIGGVSLGGGVVFLAAGIPMAIVGASDFELRRSTPSRDRAAARSEAIEPKWYLGQF